MHMAAFGQHILQTIACLLPFLEHEQIDTLPYTIAASLGTFPASLHKEIIDVLCYYIFPFTICKFEAFDFISYRNLIPYMKSVLKLDNTDDTPEKALFATQSVSAVLMMVFQHTTSSGTSSIFILTQTHSNHSNVDLLILHEG